MNHPYILTRAAESDLLRIPTDRDWSFRRIVTAISEAT